MLKKIWILTIGILIVFVFRIKKSEAYSGNGFIWNKTEISIPLNSSFDSYLDEFEVQYYYRGEILDIDVMVDIDSFYYGDIVIPTFEPGTKTVKLIATVNGYSSYDRKDIVVHIVDEILPAIKQKKELIFGINESINYDDYFIFSDNHEVTSKLIDDSDVNYSLPGKYTLIIKIADYSGNLVERKFNVIVMDKTIPNIVSEPLIEIPYGDTYYSLSGYVTVYDEYDGDLSDLLIVSGLDVYTLGEQNVILSVTDKSGNTSKISTSVFVVDQEAPMLELKTYYDTISISDEIDFKDYVLSASDNCEELSIDDVIIDDTKFLKEYGTYVVSYKLIDGAGNYTIRNLNISVNYDSKPEINCNNLVFTINDNFDLYDYVVVTDEYDDDIQNELKLDTSALDRNKIGVYEVIAEATNKAGHTTTKSFYVTITGVDEGIFNKAQEFISKYRFEMIGAIIVITGIIIYYFKRKNKTKIGQ